eukprot:4473025-Prorocentrum_lima.AAC.1
MCIRDSRRRMWRGDTEQRPWGEEAAAEATYGVGPAPGVETRDHRGASTAPAEAVPNARDKDARD